MGASRVTRFFSDRAAQPLPTDGRMLLRAATRHSSRYPRSPGPSALVLAWLWESAPFLSGHRRSAATVIYPPAMLASAPPTRSSHDLLDRAWREPAAWRACTSATPHGIVGAAPARRAFEHLEDAAKSVRRRVRYLPRVSSGSRFPHMAVSHLPSRARVARRRARLWSFSRCRPRRPRLVENRSTRPSHSSVAKAIARLSEAERVAFVLFELEGLSGQEIAEVIERPQATVFRRLHDARKRFTAALEEGI